MRKITALIAGGVGYVLGTRAGRERYDQIKQAAMRLKSNPKVQQTAHQVADAAKEAAPVVKDKVTGGSKSDSAAPPSPTGVPMEGSAYPRSDGDAKS